MPRLTGRITCLCIGLALASAATMSPGPARAVEARSARIVDLTYDVYLGALHIFTFDVDLMLQPGRYRASAEGETRGMLDWLYALDMKLVADGSDHNGRIEPRRYTAETEWRRKQRTVYLGFGEDGAYELRQTPPPEPDPDIEGELPETLPEGILDPLSLAISASRALEENGRCDQTVPVFDGRRRYDLTIKHLEQTVLPPSSHSIYQGPAMRCSFSMERISGFRKSRRSSRQWDAGSARPPTVWMAAIRQDLPPVPVRYEGEIALGNMVIHLTDADVRSEPVRDIPDDRLRLRSAH